MKKGSAIYKEGLKYGRAYGYSDEELETYGELRRLEGAMQHTVFDEYMKVCIKYRKLCKTLSLTIENGK